MSSPGQEKAAWTEDYAVAVEEAKQQQKSLFLLFTGDWIPLCQKFDSDILNTEHFLENVSEHFVLVRLNFPEDNQLPKNLASQNQLLKDAYRIRGFPAIVLTHSDGKPFGLNGFQPVTPEVFTQQILDMNEIGEQKQASREAADELEGAEMVEALIEGIPELPGNMAARYFGEEMKRILAADPENTFGKANEFVEMMDDVQYSKAMQLLAKDSQWDKMIELTDSYISERKLEGGMLQKALLNKSSVQAQMGSLRGRIESLLRVVEIDVDSGYGQEAQRQLDELKSEKSSQESEEP
ncbi:MAG: thioredoxin family protein [Verrucomicrobiales bacterium]|nr:thioredoxin family protein [Verrucomicrobiales bacterium]